MSKRQERKERLDLRNSIKIVRRRIVEIEKELGKSWEEAIAEVRAGVLDELEVSEWYSLRLKLERLTQELK